ncbi:otoconin-90-like [Thamnophis elegans]|uniref:otoconin-90-like n=1 Tax=Thamnophis elegans TaxID=35005 RepID=UPI001378A993|nr:otoconin-90-like [Thamnophis elegans]
MNLTGMVNGTKEFFSLLSIVSYSSYAFHKVSIVLYNISSFRNIDPTKFSTRYCYCLNNGTNDLTDFTALLVDIVGNSTSYLTEIFKSTSIVSVSQSNDTDCIYICVMSGRIGRNLTDLWEAIEKSPLVNYTFSGNISDFLDNITFFNGVFENVESVALFFDCLGSHFTWLQSVFTSFPPLLNFVSRMKCVTGVCPRDFEDYGCACRFEMEGFPVDEVDGCCFQHRKCYEEATEEDCTWDPTKIIMNVSCLTKNITCGSEDSCEHLLCDCDREAIECFLHSPINSSLNNFDASLCSSLVTGATSETSSVKVHTTVPASDVPQEFNDLTLNNHERFSSDIESSGVLENFRGGAVTQKEATVAFDNSELRVCDRFSFLQRGENGKLNREFPQLGEMLYCLTDRCPEEFELYGCFCGQEGRGHPTDELDRCCFSHQCCLEQVKRLGCQPEKTSRSEVVCFDHTPTCVGWTLCENLLCSCDKAAAECMAAAPFNETRRLPSRQDCREDKLACRWSGRERPPSSPPRGSRTSSEEEEESSSEEAGTI